MDELLDWIHQIDHRPEGYVSSSDDDEPAPAPAAPPAKALPAGVTAPPSPKHATTADRFTASQNAARDEVERDSERKPLDALEAKTEEELQTKAAGIRTTLETKGQFATQSSSPYVRHDPLFATGPNAPAGGHLIIHMAPAGTPVAEDAVEVTQLSREQWTDLRDAVAATPSGRVDAMDAAENITLIEAVRDSPGQLQVRDAETGEWQPVQDKNARSWEHESAVNRSDKFSMSGKFSSCHF